MRTAERNGGMAALILDLDGVLTDTAAVHMHAWKRAFDEYLADRAGRGAETRRPFSEDDYRRHVDGKPRYEGVASFLASRGISLPYGDPSDPPDAETVCGIGNRKNAYFLDALDRAEGVRVFDESLAFVRAEHQAGVRTAVVTSSKNGRRVMAAAKLPAEFDVVFDGTDAERTGVRGKPEPDTFLEAARLLGVAPGRATVVEDAVAGIEAGRRGGFGLVVGVDRTGAEAGLREAGADIVVRDLGELGAVETSACARPRGAARPIDALPSALDALPEIVRDLAGRPPAVFLDYDGTLTPIVAEPKLATLADAVRSAVAELATRAPVVVLSGRDLPDVRERVGVVGAYYAGSHGFDLLGPGGSPLRPTRMEEFESYLPDLDAAEDDLRRSEAARMPGAIIERKRFAIAAHYRQVAAEDVGRLEQAVDEVARRHPRLRRTGGKKIVELRPAIDWDKGSALLGLLGVIRYERGDHVPLFVGDDLTDEDAFRAIADDGVPIVVGDGERPTLARYRLADPSEVAAFLGRLAEEVPG